MWKYYEVLNTGLATLLVILAGAIVAYFNVLPLKTYRVLTGFVFKVSLPAAVCLAVGIKTDLYEDGIWRFIGVFLVLRAIMLAIAVLTSMLQRPKTWTAALAGTVVDWLGMSWISTVILGVPVLKAAIGPQYARLGIIAGISSFIFQLPVMLIMFELYRWGSCQLPTLQVAKGGAAADATDPKESAASNAGDGKDVVLTMRGSSEHAPVKGKCFGTPWKAIVAGILWRLVCNPILWGIAIGFILSLSTVGPDFLDPGNPPAILNEDFVEETGFIAMVLDWLGGCVTPVALFAMGMWMSAQYGFTRASGDLQQTSDYGPALQQNGQRWTKTQRIKHCAKVVAFLIVKLVIVPLITVGLAKGFDLADDYARSAVLVATIPISLASFTLAAEYEVGAPLLSKLVALGTLLMLPTVVAWLEIMDAVDLFNVQKVTPVPGSA